MSGPTRFYTEVSVVEDAGGYAVALDGKPIRTPARRPLILPTRALAEAIAEEWRAQGERIDAKTLRLTKLANTAIDRILPEPATAVGQIAGYGGTDLLCYRAAGPCELVRRQDAAWRPLLDWASERFGARLSTTEGINPVAQDADALAALRRAVEAYDPLVLVALAEATGILGSVVLGLALADGRLAGEDAFALSQLDEGFQMEQWGEDWEAAQRRNRMREDLLVAEKFLRLAAA